MPEHPLVDISTANVKEFSEREQGPQFIPALTIASHPVARRVGGRLLLSALAAGREVAVSRNEPAFMHPGHALGTHLADTFRRRWGWWAPASACSGCAVSSSRWPKELVADDKGEVAATLDFTPLQVSASAEDFWSEAAVEFTGEPMPAWAV